MVSNTALYLNNQGNVLRANYKYLAVWQEKFCRNDKLFIFAVPKTLLHNILIMSGRKMRGKIPP